MRKKYNITLSAKIFLMRVHLRNTVNLFCLTGISVHY